MGKRDLGRDVINIIAKGDGAAPVFLVQLIKGGHKFFVLGPFKQIILMGCFGDKVGQGDADAKRFHIGRLCPYFPKGIILSEGGLKRRTIAIC